jgi:hypothetical protein
MGSLNARGDQIRDILSPHPRLKVGRGPMVTQDSPSLYERLRGVYSIATVIDDFIDRIMVDPRINANQG